jgi:hypothetical protein
VVLGVAWRTLRYLLQFPIWGDEAYVCLNFLDRDLLGLTRPLRFVQVAPVLFLWVEWGAHHLLGYTELALRLLPFLAGIAALLLFVRLARLTLDPLAAVLAVGLLAVSYYPVRHSCEVKPYAFDLLAATALLLTAAAWLRRPERLAPLALLTVLAPMALAASYPSVFVTGAVSVALLPAVWRRPGWAARALYLAYNVLVGISFAALYLLVGAGQYGSTGGADNWYWQESFPPGQPFALLKWLVLIHTGNLMAYPVGGPNGLSALTCLLFLAGVWQAGRARQWDLLSLSLVPFALTLTAAALHRYPYGGSARVAQHLAPAICLLTGLGTAGLLRRLRLADTQPRWALAACVLLGLVGAGGLARDLVKPYKTEGDRMVRQIVTDVFRQAGPDDQIVIVDTGKHIGATFEWYLRQQQDRIAWDGRIDWDRLREGGQVWCLRFSGDRNCRRLVASCPAGRKLLLVDRARYELQLGKTEKTIERCEVFHWKCVPAESE